MLGYLTYQGEEAGDEGCLESKLYNESNFMTTEAKKALQLVEYSLRNLMLLTTTFSY